MQRTVVPLEGRGEGMEEEGVAEEQRPEAMRADGVQGTGPLLPHPRAYELHHDGLHAAALHALPHFRCTHAHHNLTYTHAYMMVHVGVPGGTYVCTRVCWLEGVHQGCAHLNPYAPVLIPSLGLFIGMFVHYACAHIIRPNPTPLPALHARGSACMPNCIRAHAMICAIWIHTRVRMERGKCSDGHTLWHSGVRSEVEARHRGAASGRRP